jgi:hypothetical protein
MALLSGVGAVYTPYKFLHFFLQHVDPVDGSLHSAGGAGGRQAEPLWYSFGPALS